MTIPAILTKFSIMFVRMTGCTIIVSNTFKLLVLFTVFRSYFMAGTANDILVFSNQFKICILMVKSWRGLKMFGIVAAGAIFGQGTLVFI